MTPRIGGFTTFKAEGHGIDFSSASVAERVRGRVERAVLVAVLPRVRAHDVLEAVRQNLAVPHVAYWLEPVLEVGRLTEGPEPKPATAQGEAAR